MTTDTFLEPASLDKLYELSKLDRTIFVGSEIRQLIGEIRRLRTDGVAQASPEPKKGFAFPEIAIDWQQINGQQFANSRVALMAKLTRFMSPESKESAFWSDNHFNRSEMYVLHELLKAAYPVPSAHRGGET